jgi:hypothetical protein
MRIVIRNDFTVRQITVDPSKPLSIKKIASWRRKLHSIDCTSGDDLGGRGEQIDQDQYNSLLLRSQRLILSGQSSESSDRCAVKPGFVLGSDGRIYAQMPAENLFGFVICDDDHSWAGGINSGLAHWTLLANDDPRITEDDRERIGWMLDEVA